MKNFIKNNSVLINVLVIVVLIVGMILFVVIPHYGIKNNNLTGDNQKTLDGQISIRLTSIQNDSKNIKNYISLSQLYLQKVRETADSAYYQKIDDLMDTAEKIDPKSADIAALRASVQIGRHHFKEGNEYAKKAIALNPNDHLNYGLLGDSEIELGQYKEAAAAFQKMVDIRPDYSSFIRIAYIRELYGDIKGAKEALKSSIAFGSSFNENIAFAYVELGKLDMRENLDVGYADFKDATKIVPDYPSALEGLAKIAFFKNDFKEAERQLVAAYTKLPIVQYATDLGDLYFKQGDTTKAKQYYTLAQIAFERSVKSGVDTDLEESLFLSDHELDLSRALILAKQAYEDRPSVYAADYLSWALYKNGQSDKAAQYTKSALRLGEIDPLILFHQGMIAQKNGNLAQAKRYFIASQKINPYFSILESDKAKSLAEQSLK